VVKTDHFNKKLLIKFDHIITMSLSVDYLFVLFQNQNNQSEIKLLAVGAGNEVLSQEIPNLKSIHSGGRHTFLLTRTFFFNCFFFNIFFFFR
jgi:hypothetical protein